MLEVLPLIFTGGDNPKLVIGIDEAHPLSTMTTNGFRPSHILCRAINAYSRGGKASIWAVFASTTSQVAVFSSPEPTRKYPLNIASCYFHEFLQTIPPAWQQLASCCTRHTLSL